jgi:hypothetical protein
MSKVAVAEVILDQPELAAPFARAKPLICGHVIPYGLTDMNARLPLD